MVEKVELAMDAPNHYFVRVSLALNKAGVDASTFNVFRLPGSGSSVFGATVTAAPKDAHKVRLNETAIYLVIGKNVRV